MTLAGWDQRTQADPVTERIPGLLGITKIGRPAMVNNYRDRRAKEQKSNKEIMRCLKRYIAREVYTVLTADPGPTGP